MWFVNDPIKSIYPVVWTGISLPCWQETAIWTYHALDIQIIKILRIQDLGCDAMKFDR
jgi:hypothetical protein